MVPGSSRHKVGGIPIGPPSSGSHTHTQPSLSPSQSPQHHPAGNLTIDSQDQHQVPHTSTGMAPTLHPRPGLEGDNLALSHQDASPNLAQPVPSSSNMGNGPLSSASTVAVMGSTPGPHSGMTPGPTMGPVRLPMDSPTHQQPMQPQMAPQITQAIPRKYCNVIHQSTDGK